MSGRLCRHCGSGLIRWRPPEWDDIEHWWLCPDCDMPEGS